MRDVLPDLDHVTPEWLTEVLQDQGHLQDGCVTAVHLKTTRPTAVSLVAHLEVQYTDDISVSLPSQLFLKTSRPDLIADFPLRGQKEVAFYTRTAAAMPAPLVVRCYDAVYAPEAKKFHLVLEDVSASHVQATVWPVPPVESTDRKFKSLRRPLGSAPQRVPPVLNNPGGDLTGSGFCPVISTVRRHIPAVPPCNHTARHQ